MEWLNYHHLLYFWTVATEGNVGRAAASLRLAQSTVSQQVRALERRLGVRLFERRGRGLVLTDDGKGVLAYANEIFRLGEEMLASVSSEPGVRRRSFRVGVSDVLAKLVAYQLLEPALRLPEPVALSVREDHTDRLLAELTTHELDLVLTDAPISSRTPVRAYNHLLGECGVTFLANAALAARHRRAFPRSLNGAPLLLPLRGTRLRRGIDRWLEQRSLRPAVVGEFDDSALLSTFGEAGAGIYPAVSVIEDAVRRQYRSQVVGRTDEIRERFYAVSLERQIRHPAVLAITGAAREPRK